MRFDFNFNVEIEPSEVKEILDIGEKVQEKSNSPIIASLPDEVSSGACHMIVTDDGFDLHIKDNSYESCQELLGMLIKIGSGDLSAMFIKKVSEWAEKNNAMEWLDSFLQEGQDIANLMLEQRQAEILKENEQEDIALSPINLFNNNEEL